jgi:hypothetical protein
LLGGRTREQDATAAAQLHVTYKFERTMWLAGDANYFTNGQTTISGKLNLDRSPADQPLVCEVKRPAS